MKDDICIPPYPPIGSFGTRQLLSHAIFEDAKMGCSGGFFVANYGEVGDGKVFYEIGIFDSADIARRAWDNVFKDPDSWYYSEKWEYFNQLLPLSFGEEALLLRYQRGSKTGILLTVYEAFIIDGKLITLVKASELVLQPFLDNDIHFVIEKIYPQTKNYR